MVMMTSLPFAVSKPMTTAEIENFVEGSLPNGTIIENVNTGAIAVVNAGMPQYLPYAEGIIPDVSDFVTQGEMEDFVTQLDVDTSNLMEKPVGTGSVGQVLTRANGSVPYEWANAPTGGGGFPQLVSSFMFPHLNQFLRDPLDVVDSVSHARSSDVGSAVLSSDFVEVQYHFEAVAPSTDSAHLVVGAFCVYTLASEGIVVLDDLYDVVMSEYAGIHMDPKTSRSFDIKTGLIDLRNLSSNWFSFNYCPLGDFYDNDDYDALFFNAYSILNFYKVM